MRRTLTVLVTAAALLVPATAASAAPPEGRTNASCNNGKGGNGAEWNGHGKISDCGVVRETPPKDEEGGGDVLFT